jgi:hypothetical protein
MYTVGLKIFILAELPNKTQYDTKKETETRVKDIGYGLVLSGSKDNPVSYR